MDNPATTKQKERIRLMADRLCYLAEGQRGLCDRHAMQLSDREHADKYDTQAQRIAGGKESAGALKLASKA